MTLPSLRDNSLKGIRKTIDVQLASMVAQTMREHPGIPRYVIIRHIILRAFKKLPTPFVDAKRLLLKALNKAEYERKTLQPHERRLFERE
jgi:hypothetical protein